MDRLLVVAALVHSVFSSEMQLTAFKATQTPCCMDLLLPNVCRALYNRDHERFSRQCRTNPDFSFIQCCHSCHFNADLFTSNVYPVPADLYRKDAEELLLNPSGQHCSDRHGTAFCEAFVTKQGIWGRRQLNCDHSAFAFRVCRKTCGYCTGNRTATVHYDSTIARTPKACQRLF